MTITPGGGEDLSGVSTKKIFFGGFPIIYNIYVVLVGFLDSFPTTWWRAGCSGSYSRTYSVMQSDGNSFGGDVVLNSFNKASRDEGNILDQTY